jgi:drug/metabolite transporter (DMT)-like permease
MCGTPRSSHQLLSTTFPITSWGPFLRLMNRFNQTSQHIPLKGALLLILLCLIWGGNFVGIKLSVKGIPPLLAATIRSVVAACLLWLCSRALHQRVSLPHGLVKHGVAIGLLFGAQFLFLYWGLCFTDASRAVMFCYAQPLATAIMAHFIFPDDRLHLVKAMGIFVAFIGLTIVLGSRSQSAGQLYWLGDTMELAAGLLWAVTTIYVKKVTRNTPITHFQTLFAQLFFSIPFLAASSIFLEWPWKVDPDPVATAALVYQCVIVAFISYLLWFRMIHSYPVSRLAAFTFLTPLFGVILSGLLLKESLTLSLWIGLGLVAAGIYLVNRPYDPQSRGLSQA